MAANMNSGITLRKARLDELSLLATIGTEAFENNSFFHLFLPLGVPNRFNKLFEFNYHRLYRRMLDPKTAVVVAEIDGEVAGHISWKRFGKGGSWILGLGEGEGGWGYCCRPWEQWIRRKIEGWWSWWYGVRPKEVLDMTWLDYYAKVEARTIEKVYTTWPERWNMQHLAVRPSFWRRGVGQALSKWGQDVAAKEEGPIAVTLEASASGKKVYDKLGFTQVDWWDIPLDHGCPVMVWLPEGEIPEFEWLEWGEKMSNKRVNGSDSI